MAPKRSITAVVAATLDNGIGRDGGLPWRLPGEMKYFARVTTGEALPTNTHNAVIMGRKTWDGIPSKFRPLKDRHNLVVSRAGVDVGDAHLTTPHSSLEAAISSVPDTTHRTFLIGGAQLYNQSLPEHVDRVLLTRVLESLPCDAFLDDFTTDKRWRRAPHAELREWVGWEVPEGDVEEKGIRYRFEMWVKDL
ncbi:Dihydrofolate reductase [Vanrija pseudolonga]|uniref:Dihydrofolate reductase n=1 Tax=Vanrija pseudolonga TaxID=143232 RepID=A0AAF1BLV3_9TREE|nr:Dihydrofolate reductase [Vanrija pseudolonga]